MSIGVNLRKAVHWCKALSHSDAFEGRRLKAEGRKLKAEGRGQKAESRKQKAEG